jgi:hypothetical protein
MLEVLAQPKAVAASYKQLAVALDVNERRVARAVRGLSKLGLIHDYYVDMFDNRAQLVIASPITLRKIQELLAVLEPIENDIVLLVGAELSHSMCSVSSLRPEPPEPRARPGWWMQTHYWGSEWRR